MKKFIFIMLAAILFGSAAYGQQKTIKRNLVLEDTLYFTPADTISWRIYSDSTERLIVEFNSDTVWQKGINDFINIQLTGSITDGTPTDAEIDTIVGDTPANVGTGYRVTILDSDGTGLIYIVESDGTNWQFVAMTIAS